MRAKSILRKANYKKTSIVSKPKELTEEEKRLLCLILQFPSKVEYATKERKPNIIASYCLDLARAFNKFYTNCPVLSVDKEITEQRLATISAYLQTLENALWLLGIDIPEKM